MTPCRTYFDEAYAFLLVLQGPFPVLLCPGRPSALQIGNFILLYISPAINDLINSFIQIKKYDYHKVYLNTQSMINIRGLSRITI
jgi:hypothetical protein